MNKKINLLIGAILSLVGLYYAFQNLDSDQLWLHFQNLNHLFIIFVFVLFIFSIHVRAKRWQLLLSPMEELPISPLFSATVIGYFGNSVLPFRLGELLRGYSLSKDCSLQVSSIMGTIVLDRILDFAGLFLFAGFFMFIYPLEPWLKTGLLTILILLFSAFIIIYLIGQKKQQWEKINNALTKIPNPIIKKIFTFILNMIDGFSQLGQTKNKDFILYYTILLWFIYFLCVYLVILAVGIDLNWHQAGLLLIATTLSISVPAAPGYLGTYHAVVIYLLVSVFGMEKDISQAFAIILHAVGFIPFVIVGAYYFTKSSVRLGEIKNG